MTDEELSRKIAEHLGWRRGTPDDGQSIRGVPGWHHPNCRENKGGDCYEGSVFLQVPSHAFDCNAKDECGIVLPDMVNDPAMTVMLLKKLLQSGANICGAGAPTIGAEWPDVSIAYGATTEQEVRHSDLGRAVAEAYYCAFIER